MVGPILIIVIVAVIYIFFNKVDIDKSDKDAQIHVKRTMADVELGKLKVQQEELKLKQEVLKFKRSEGISLPVPKNDTTPLGIDVDYRIIEQLEDNTKSKKK